MIHILFTLDYEVHGNGAGSPEKLMIQPTNEILRLFDRFNAKLTIMADTVEILRFKNNSTNEYKQSYYKILEQLKDTIKRQHDVQLHLHPAFKNAEIIDNNWKLDYSKYNMSQLTRDEACHLVNEGKTFLEENLKEIDPEYKCTAFRACNWDVQPSDNISHAMKKNGLTIDTSVFKYGVKNSIVKFDYTDAVSNLIPWPASNSDFAQMDINSSIYEFPIYCTEKKITHFFTLNRILNHFLNYRHKLPQTDTAGEKGKTASKKDFPWKADFNQCSGKQLIRELKNVYDNNTDISVDIPFVLIGHSKVFNSQNRRSLECFLKYIKDNPDKYKFSTFKDIDLDQYREYNNGGSR